MDAGDALRSKLASRLVVARQAWLASTDKVKVSREALDTALLKERAALEDLHDVEREFDKMYGGLDL